MLFIIFKKKHLSDNCPSWRQARRTTYAYQNLLRDTMLTGFNNTYTALWIMAFTGSMGAYLIVHYVTISVNNSWEPLEQEVTLPGSIIGFACLLMGMNLLQFLRNPALRYAFLNQIVFYDLINGICINTRNFFGSGIMLFIKWNFGYVKTRNMWKDK